MAVNSYQTGQADERPWGHWEVLDVGAGYAVKRIRVKPGGKLSLQLHFGRSEHWIIAAGLARVTLGEETMVCHANRAIYIPATAEHRIENIGEGELVFIEVQIGERLDEADIVRLHDVYDRATVPA